MDSDREKERIGERERDWRGGTESGKMGISKRYEFEFLSFFPSFFVSLPLNRPLPLFLSLFLVEKFSSETKRFACLIQKGIG